MEFERLIADFSEAAGFGMETDSDGTAWCEASARG